MSQNEKKSSKKKPMQIVYVIIISICIGLSGYTLQYTQDLQQFMSSREDIISEVTKFADFLSSQNDKDYHANLIKVDTEVIIVKCA